MSVVRVGTLLLGSALFLQACASNGASAPQARASETDSLIMGVMSSEEQSCPKHLTMYCTGTGALRMQCSCQSHEALQQALAGFQGAYW